MPGHNHKATCTCGWCTLGRSPQPETRSTTFTLLAVQSVTTPNARCPVCGRAVFFYAAPEGGRVYFDELGPPWPKHPCTDRAAIARAQDAPNRRADRALEPDWAKNGWIPLSGVTASAHRERAAGWANLTAVELGTRAHVEVLVPEHLPLRRDSLVYMYPWDEYGTTVLSFLESSDGSDIQERVVQVWSPGRYGEVTPADAQRYASLLPLERWRTAVSDLTNTLPVEVRSVPGPGRTYAERNRNRVQISPEKIQAAVERAVGDAHRRGWQSDRNQSLRMESALREALSRHGLRFESPLVEILTVLRAFS